MDDSAIGIATAALALHSELLKVLVRRAILTNDEALDIVDSALQNTASHPDAESILEAADIARISLQGLREGLLGLTPELRVSELSPQ
jgi:hypothetical protein